MQKINNNLIFFFKIHKIYGKFCGCRICFTVNFTVKFYRKKATVATFDS